MNNKKEYVYQLNEYVEEFMKDPRNIKYIDDIGKMLSVIADKNVSISIVYSKKKDPFGIMSIFPEIGTIDTIVDNIVSEGSYDSMKSIWSNNNNYLIEIDNRILNGGYELNGKPLVFTSEEVTALLLHEIGHVVIDNEFIRKIGKYLKLEYAKANIGTKNILKDKIYRNMIKIPLINELILDDDDITNTKNEIRADSVVIRMGYKKPLISALNKIIKYMNGVGSKIKLTTNPLVSSAQLSFKMANSLRDRRNTIDANYSKMYASTPFPSIKNLINDIRFKVTSQQYHEEVNINDDSPTTRATKLYNAAYYDRFEEGFLSSLFKKKLKPLDWGAIDYVLIEGDNMNTPNKKLLLVSYATSKLDEANYYKNILLSDPESKKYIVPHSLSDIDKYISEIKAARNKVLNKRIKDDWTIDIDLTPILDIRNPDKINL